MAVKGLRLSARDVLTAEMFVLIYFLTPIGRLVPTAKGHPRTEKHRHRSLHIQSSSHVSIQLQSGQNYTGKIVSTNFISISTVDLLTIFRNNEASRTQRVQEYRCLTKVKAPQTSFQTRNQVTFTMQASAGHNYQSDTEYKKTPNATLKSTTVTTPTRQRKERFIQVQQNQLFNSSLCVKIERQL